MQVRILTAGHLEWLTSTTAKTLDLDGDDVYGTAGQVHWGNASHGQGTFWGWVGSDFQYNPANGSFSQVDKTGDPGVDMDAGIIGPGGFDFTIIDSWTTVRIGVMHDVLTPGEYALDTDWFARITDVATGNFVESEVLPAANGVVDMVFFDLTNVAAGSEYIVSGYRTIDTGQVAYLANISMDAVPEPATMLLLGLGGLLIRRKK